MSHIASERCYNARDVQTVYFGRITHSECELVRIALKYLFVAPGRLLEVLVRADVLLVQPARHFYRPHGCHRAKMASIAADHVIEARVSGLAPVLEMHFPEFLVVDVISSQGQSRVVALSPIQLDQLFVQDFLYLLVFLCI